MGFASAQPILRTMSENLRSSRRHAIYPEHHGLRALCGIAEAVRPAAGEPETVAGLQVPGLVADGERHLAFEHEAGFLAVMGVEFIARGAAGLHMHQEQIELAVSAGGVEQLLGDTGAPEF